MGLFGDNFYSWLYGGDKNDRIEKQVQDAQPNGYKHPDGSPCRAKSIETCPFYHKDKTEAEQIDKLESETPSYDRKLKELKRLYDSKELEKFPSLRDATLEQLTDSFNKFLQDLEKYESEDHDVKWHDTQKIRDDVFSKHMSEQFSSFYPNGNKAKLDSGYGVTFHTTRSDEDLTSEEYDEKVTELCSLGGVNNFLVGIFEGGPEISIACPDSKRAIAMMLHWNQAAVWGFAEEVGISNQTFDKKENNPQ